MGQSQSCTSTPPSSGHLFAPSTSSLEETWPSVHGGNPLSSASSSSCQSFTSSSVAASSHGICADVKAEATLSLARLTDKSVSLPEACTAALDLVLLLHKDAEVYQCFTNFSLVELLERLHDASKEQQGSLLRLLSQLAMRPEFALQLHDAGFVQQLLSAIGRNMDAAISQHGLPSSAFPSPNCIARALTNVASLGPDVKQQMIQLGAPRFAAQLLHVEFPLKTRCLAALTLKTLLCSEPAVQLSSELLSTIWLPLIKLLLQPDPTAVRTCCFLLSYLIPQALQQQQMAAVVLQSDIVALLAACLDSSNASSLRAVLSTLAQLTAAQQATQQLAQQDLAVERLCQLSSHGNREVQQQALSLLLALTCDSAAASSLAAAPAGQAAMDIFLRAAVHPDDATFEAGCRGISNLQQAAGAGSSWRGPEEDVEEEAAALQAASREQAAAVAAAGAAATELLPVPAGAAPAPAQLLSPGPEVLPALLMALRTRPAPARAASLRAMLSMLQRSGLSDGSSSSSSSSSSTGSTGSSLGSCGSRANSLSSMCSWEQLVPGTSSNAIMQHQEQPQRQLPQPQPLQQQSQQPASLLTAMADLGAGRILMDELQKAGTAGDHSAAVAAVQLLAALLPASSRPGMGASSPRLLQLLLQLLPADDDNLALACTTALCSLDLRGDLMQQALLQGEAAWKLTALLQGSQEVAEGAAAALLHACTHMPSFSSTLLVHGAVQQLLTLLSSTASRKEEAAGLLALLVSALPGAVAQAVGSEEHLQQLMLLLHQPGSCKASWLAAAACMHALLQQGSSNACSASACSSICAAALEALHTGSTIQQQRAALLLAQLPRPTILVGLQRAQPTSSETMLCTLGSMLSCGLQHYMASLARRSRDLVLQRCSLDGSEQSRQRRHSCAVQQDGDGGSSADGGSGPLHLVQRHASWTGKLTQLQGSSPKSPYSESASLSYSRLSPQEASCCYLPTAFGMPSAGQQSSSSNTSSSVAAVEVQAAACTVLAKLAAALQQADTTDASNGSDHQQQHEKAHQQPEPEATARVLEQLLALHYQLLPDLLAALLGARSSSPLCLPALQLLASLAELSPDAQEAQVLEGAVLVLTQQLGSGSRECVVAAARGLRALLVGCDVAAAEAVKVGAISLLQQLMHSGGCMGEEVAREARATLRAALLRRELLVAAAEGSC
jgi:hypothetical protein